MILCKSGNPVPQDFQFSEPNKRDVWSPPRTPFGTLRRSLSKTSLRYRSGTLHKSSKFPSMFSLRSHSAKLPRKSFRAERSQESIDKIEEDEESDVKRNSLEEEDETPSLDNSFEERAVDVVSSTPVRQRTNPFLRTRLSNGYQETHFDQTEEDSETGRTVSRDILEDVINNIDVKSHAQTQSYDDRKNPFMDDLYDESLLAA